MVENAEDWSEDDDWGEDREKDQEKDGDKDQSLAEQTKTLLDCLEHGSMVLQGLPSSLEAAQPLSPPQMVADDLPAGGEAGWNLLGPPVPLYPSFWASSHHQPDKTAGNSYIPVGPGVAETAGQPATTIERLWWQWVWTAVVEPQPGICPLEELLIAWRERWVDFPELYNALCACLQKEDKLP